MKRADAIDPAFGTETTIDGENAGTMAANVVRPDWAHPDAKLSTAGPVPRAPRFCDPRKVKLLPQAWRPMYDELSRRMYGGAVGAFDFAYHPGADMMILRPFDYIGPRQEGWTDFRTPAALAAFLGVETAAKRPAAASKPPVARTSDQGKRVPPVAKPQVSASSKVETRDMPAWAAEYLGRLVYETKRDYAAAYIAHIVGGADAPEHPGAEWADKVHAKVRKLAPAS